VASDAREESVVMVKVRVMVRLTTRMIRTKKVRAKKVTMETPP
jgi:hypothetical protein